MDSLSDTTIVFASYNRKQIFFTLGDCEKDLYGIYINNAQKMDEELGDPIPKKVSLKQIEDLSVSEKNIEEYFKPQDFISWRQRKRMALATAP